MTELEAIFAELGIQQYLHDFLEQGFDTWETILDITESDFDALGVKLGHRRKLQRKIANSRGISSDIALDASSRNTPSDDRASDEAKLGGTKSDAGSSGSVAGAKRKYRRHPRADEHAPERPPSAYVIFSNKMREDIKGQSLSFTEIAKLVGENWQALPAREKESYEQQASAAKERYNNEMTEYKKTAHYKEYQLYLADFKARQANQQQGMFQKSLESNIVTNTF
ncbi:high mobility group box domain-containing protein [Bisporella sp. PMI_857]|nr:high mobility group box domain-containing protein [Bisporella sp. PMI_857]